MVISVVLWALIWGGMYSDISRFKVDALVAGPLNFVFALRPFMPLLAMALCFVLLVRTRRLSLTLERGPFLMLSLYGLLGGLFFFMSPVLEAAICGRSFPSRPESGNRRRLDRIV